jgi:hypothetical protein
MLVKGPDISAYQVRKKTMNPGKTSPSQTKIVSAMERLSRELG